MEIFEMMSFDFKDFITSPGGILIIVGVICLIVGIIMLLKGDKKKKPVEEVKHEEPVNETKKEEPVVETTAPVEPKMVVPVIETPAVTPAPEVLAPTVEAPVVVPATNDGVNETPVPVMTETLNITEPVESTSEVESLATNEVLEPVVEKPVESLDTQTSVYGGVNPEVSVSEVQSEPPREIYGGANPLENTAPIPSVQNVGAYQASVVQPVVETPVTQEVVNDQPVLPVSETPVVETPQVSETPSIVEATPVVETPSVVEVAPVVATPQVNETPSVVETTPVVAAPQITPTVNPKPEEEIEKLEF